MLRIYCSIQNSIHCVLFTFFCLVRMRIVAVDFEMKPYKGNVTIEISDGHGTKVQQWIDKSPLTGIVPLSFPLSDEPVAGVWNVSVFALYPPAVEKSEVQTSCFQVKEYVLPKFEVTVIVPPYIVTIYKTAPVTVVAKYTYGRPVKGVACVTARSVYDYRYRLPRTSASQTCKKIDGITDFNMLLGSKFYASRSYYKRYLSHVEFNVTVIEKGTQTAINSTETVVTSEYDYVASFLPGSPRMFKPGLPFTLKINVMTPDLVPFFNRTNVTLDFFVSQYPSNRKIHSTVVEAMNGTAEFEVFLERNHFSNDIVVKAIVDSANTAIHTIQVNGFIGKPQITTRSEEELLFPGSNELTFYTTQAVETNLFLLASSKGALLRSWTKTVKGKKSGKYSGVHEFRISINVSCAMTPQFHLVSYYIEEKNTAIADVITLRVQPCFQHKVNVAFSLNETKPGRNIQMSITADPGSMVSLSAVDKSVYLVPSSCTNQMTAENVLAEMSKYDVHSSISDDDESSLYSLSDTVTGGLRDWWRSWWPNTEYPQSFRAAGIAVMSSYHFGRKKVYRFKRQVGSGDGGEDEEGGLAGIGRVRTFFPETWLWEDHIADANGHVMLNLTVPDTVTTWVADAFAISESSAFGIAEMPATVLAFQPFFVSLSLPYSVIRGEEMTVIATVFNYYHENLTVLVVLEKQLSEFRFSDGDGSKRNTTILVQSKDSATVRFHIVPLQLGYIPLKVSAYSSFDSDAVLRTLLVEPEGVEKRDSQSAFVSSSTNLEFPLELPNYVVNGSARVVLSMTGDFMGPAISCLGSLLRMPYGCGEQNLINFAPAVYIKKYLVETDSLTPATDQKTRKIMSTGYQRELTYQRRDGSYAAFGDRSRKGSLCLTALVMRVYAQALPYMYIDIESMSRSLCWLINQQSEDGSLGVKVDVATGELYCASVGSKETVQLELTAYNIMALLEVKRKLKNKELQCNAGNVVIDDVARKSILFLLKNIDNVVNPYSKAMVAYALAMANEEESDALIDQLFSLADRKGDTCFWSLGQQCRRSYRCRYQPSSIQTAAYVILACVERDRIAETVCVVSWLSEQMDGCGGYRSTQDTVLALFALSQAARIIYSDDSINVTLHVTMENHINKTFKVNDNNKVITQREEIAIFHSTHVKARGTGSGHVLFQADLTYNIPNVDPSDSFQLNVSVEAKAFNLDEITFDLNRFTRNSQDEIDELPNPDDLFWEEDPDIDEIDKEIEKEIERHSRETEEENNERNTPTQTVSFANETQQQQQPTVLITNVCFKWKRLEEKPGMVIIEVGLLSGFQADSILLQQLFPKTEIGLMRYEVKRRVTTFYFDEFPQDRPLCFSFEQKRSHCVANLRPAYVRAYSYYQPDFSTTVKYDPPEDISNNNLVECDAEIISGDVVEIVSSGEISSSGSGGGQNFG
ncbi:C3 and PZP-like alpha-2-macroglobulin domain-containing protein 8 isoform X2 [Corticium candelabrum]|uniref:C3 and PZP-like alpha-2-macroglobulin domain-containing protein 8 isoform X2 n=1 Tax=Corticium candelabrum TaxID=121492 RepID=UPI002E2671E1|nr:C3 and PZP-like alpha-2-macroglobulin domain-containing protein 8 isoform X2 [Corticium candelabrum]